jgi:hypothetical protein
MISTQQALANLFVLHRKVKMVPEEHEAIQESIAVLGDLISPAVSNRRFNIDAKTAFENMIAVYNRALLSVEEFEAMKESFNVISKIVKNFDNLPQDKPKISEMAEKGKK